MTLQQIHLVGRLASLGSINAAAKSLGVTQPAISTSLLQLEAELGIRLFIRSRQGVQLTRKGRELLPHFRSLLRTESDILMRSSVLPDDRGSLKVAGRQGFMKYVFPSLYRILKRRYPGITIESVLSSNQEEVIEALTSGRVDLAFAPRPKVKSISSETIFEDPVFIGIARRNKSMRTKRKLQHIEFCMPTGADRLRKPLERLIRTVVRTPVIAIESDDYTLLGKLVAAGEFAGPIYGHMLLDEEIRRDIVPIGLFKPPLKRDLTVLYRRDELLPHIRTAKDLFATETSALLSKIVKWR